MRRQAEETGCDRSRPVRVSKRQRGSALKLRFRGDVIGAEGSTGWTTGIKREKGRSGVSADVNWKSSGTGSDAEKLASRLISGFVVTLRGQWRRGLGYASCAARAVDSAVDLHMIAHIHRLNRCPSEDQRCHSLPGLRPRSDSSRSSGGQRCTTSPKKRDVSCGVFDRLGY